MATQEKSIDKALGIEDKEYENGRLAIAYIRHMINGAIGIDDTAVEVTIKFHNTSICGGYLGNDPRYKNFVDMINSIIKKMEESYVRWNASSFCSIHYAIRVHIPNNPINYFLPEGVLKFFPKRLEKKYVFSTLVEGDNVIFRNKEKLLRASINRINKEADEEISYEVSIPLPGSPKKEMRGKTIYQKDIVAIERLDAFGKFKIDDLEKFKLFGLDKTYYVTDFDAFEDGVLS